MHDLESDDLSGFDPADPTKDPKIFQIERILVYLHWLDEKRLTARDVLRWDHPGGRDLPKAILELTEMQDDLEQARGHLGRLKQLLS